MREAALTEKKKNNNRDIEDITGIENLRDCGWSTVTKKTKRSLVDISDDEVDMRVEQRRHRSQTESKRV